MDTQQTSPATASKRKSTKAPVTPLLYSIAEFCELTRTAHTVTYELMRLGLLKFVMIAGNRRIPHSELVRACEEGIPVPPEIQAERTAKLKAYKAELAARKAAGEVVGKKAKG